MRSDITTMRMIVRGARPALPAEIRADYDEINNPCTMGRRGGGARGAKKKTLARGARVFGRKVRIERFDPRYNFGDC